MHSIEKATAIARDLLDLAEEMADRTMKRADDIGGLTAMFLARAHQALDSVILLANRGSIADAMAVARTIIELDIDHAYISQEPVTRVVMFSAYELVAGYKIAVAIDDLHGGTIDRELMALVKERRDDALTAIVEASGNEKPRDWAGNNISERATAVGRANAYRLAYRDMCGASHSGMATLRYAMVGSDDAPRVHFGLMTPNEKPIELASMGMLSLIASASVACAIDDLDGAIKTVQDALIPAKKSDEEPA